MGTSLMNRWGFGGRAGGSGPVHGRVRNLLWNREFWAREVGDLDRNGIRM